VNLEQLAAVGGFNGELPLDGSTGRLGLKIKQKGHCYPPVVQELSFPQSRDSSASGVSRIMNKRSIAKSLGLELPKEVVGEGLVITAVCQGLVRVRQTWPWS